MSGAKAACLVCAGQTRPLDQLDFNKSCGDAAGVPRAPSGRLVEYVRCEHCQFIFAPEFQAWTTDDFRAGIYNDGYIEVDPEYVEARPRRNAALLQQIFGEHAASIRHLDYGGGNGQLSAALAAKGWDSHTYDPLQESSASLDELGRFDLITAFEVFEHVPVPASLMAGLAKLMQRPGVVWFSTLVSDGQVQPGQPLTWWYASPRNGHISLFSRRSLAILAARHELVFFSATDDTHLFVNQPPDWLKSVFGLRS